MNLFLRWKRSGKSPVTQRAEIVLLLGVLATAQLVREGKHSEAKGTLP